MNEQSTLKSFQELKTKEKTKHKNENNQNILNLILKEFLTNKFVILSTIISLIYLIVFLVISDKNITISYFIPAYITTIISSFLQQGINVITGFISFYYIMENTPFWISNISLLAILPLVIITIVGFTVLIFNLNIRSILNKIKNLVAEELFIISFLKNNKLLTAILFSGILNIASLFILKIYIYMSYKPFEYLTNQHFLLILLIGISLIILSIAYFIKKINKSKRALTYFKELSIIQFFSTNSLTSILILGGIFFILLLNSAYFFIDEPISKILDSLWNPQGYYEAKYGVFSMIYSSIMVTMIAMIIAIPIGILSAVYLVYLAPYWLSEILKPIIEMLAAIPSVVIGFLGIVLIGPIIVDISQIFAGWSLSFANLFSDSSSFHSFFKDISSYFANKTNGLNALNGGILLAIMALPTIVSISEDSLRAVPKSYIEASYALGATKWQTLWKICIPSALSGIIASIMLGFGRAIGETMTVLMVCGNAIAMPVSIFDQVRTLTATIAIEMGEVDFHSTHYYALFMVGLVLFIFTFIVNNISYLLSRKYQEVDR